MCEGKGECDGAGVVNFTNVMEMKLRRNEVVRGVPARAARGTNIILQNLVKS